MTGFLRCFWFVSFALSPNPSLSPCIFSTNQPVFISLIVASKPPLQDLLLLLTHLPLLTSLLSLLLNIYLLLLPATILFRCPPIVLVQMVGNLWIDAVLWAVGVLGGWRAKGRGTRSSGWRFGFSTMGGLGDGLKGAGMRNLELLEVSTANSFISLSLPVKVFAELTQPDRLASIRFASPPSPYRIISSPPPQPKPPTTSSSCHPPTSS